jgi:branched-chain amino acid aminotransferase
VRSINGRTVGDGPRAGKVPGPVTKKLIEAYAKSVDFDFMAQYLRHLA